MNELPCKEFEKTLLDEISKKTGSKFLSTDRKEGQDYHHFEYEGNLEKDQYESMLIIVKVHIDNNYPGMKYDFSSVNTDDDNWSEWILIVNW
jgi:hypothetical protein